MQIIFASTYNKALYYLSLYFKKNMKLRHVLLFAFISTFISLTACKDNKADAATETPTSTSPEGATGEQPATFNTGTTGATSATGSKESHYKCTTAGCTGSGDAQGKCPVCGAELVHNPGFHSAAPGATTGTSAVTPGSSPTNPVVVNPSNTPTPAQTPASDKNAKGVYHYTCPKGHEGGAASAGKCAKCGEALTHNQAYHN